MKKMFTLALAALMSLTVLAGCGAKDQEDGSNPAASTDRTPAELTEIYKEAIENSGVDQEFLQYNPILTSAEDEESATALEMLQFDPAKMEAFAVAASLMNTQAYTIAAVKPAEGQEEAVVEMLQAYIDRQIAAFERYLPEPYEVAKATRLETLEDGTVLMVMYDNQDELFDAISGAILSK